MIYKIEKGIPRPTPYSSLVKYPFPDMEIGDSFFVPGKSRVRAAASEYGKKMRGKVSFSCLAVVEGGVKGVRVWRVEAPAQEVPAREQAKKIVKALSVAIDEDKPRRPVPPPPPATPKYGVPKPETKPRHDFEVLGKGDHMFIPFKTAKEKIDIRNAAHYYARTHAKKFTTITMVRDGVQGTKIAREF